jgi:hypothetical protein
VFLIKKMYSAGFGFVVAVNDTRARSCELRRPHISNNNYVARGAVACR